MLKGMPSQPSWLSDLDAIRNAVCASPRPFVDCATVQALLRVGRRRAQQILAPCVTERVGTNGLAERAAFLRCVEQVAAGEEARGEVERRQRVARTLAQLRRERIEQPQLPVEAPVTIINQEWSSLRPGVQLEPCRLTIEFDESQEALEKLLALAMAISNDFEEFERRTQRK
jgi:hypothetical protein